MAGRGRHILALPRLVWVALRQRRERHAARSHLRRYARDPSAKWTEALDWLQRRPALEHARAACVVTCHDDWPFLPDLLLSLRAQTLAEFQLVVVDDASTEPRSREMAAELARVAPGVVMQLSANVGLPGARNRGVARTSAPIVACLDADDVLSPRFLEITVGALEASPELGFVYFDHFEFGDVQRHVRSRNFDLGELVRQNYVVAAAPFRRQAWQQVSGYREDLVHGYEDWDLWVRLARAGWRGRRIPRTLFYYRKRGGSMLEDTLRRHRDLASLVHERGVSGAGGAAAEDRR